MRRANRYIASLFLTAALVAPVSIMAASGLQDRETKDQVRVYDKDHNDFHDWNDNEKKAWERYHTEKHIAHHEFSNADEKERADYWNWRHAHPDKE